MVRGLSKLNTEVSFRSGCLLVAAFSIARGTSCLFSKQLLDSMEPLTLLGTRFLWAFFILFLLFYRKVIEDIKNNPEIVPASFFLGGVYFVCMTAELVGLQYTSASICSFLENSAIVIVPVIEAVLLRRFPLRVIIFSTVVTFIGIGLIIFGSGSGMDGNGYNGILSGLGLGEILCMIAALCYSAAIIITDRVSKKYAPMTLGILYVGVMGSLGMFASFIFETPHLPDTGSQWLMLLALAVVCTAFGFTVQPLAQKALSSETTSIICALNPLTAAGLGWLFLGDNLGSMGLVGAVLILSGIILPNMTWPLSSAKWPLSSAKWPLANAPVAVRQRKTHNLL